MPIYEYLCMDCDQTFDALRGMSDADKMIRCERCDGERTIRKLSVFYAQSGGRLVAGTSSSCGGCTNGDCGGCACGRH